MAQTVREIMTTDPVSLPAGSSLMDAARIMRDSNIGDVLVTESGGLHGIVTDRDIVVRGLAEGRDPASTTLAHCCSQDLVTVAPDDELGKVVQLVRGKAIRRLPVVEGGQPVGIVSLGDLAAQLDPESALADVSSAPANR